MLFRRKRDGKPAGPWVARYRDGRGLVVQRSTGCKDKGAAEAMLTGWRTQAENIKAGVLLEDDLDRAQWGRDPVETHLEEWLAALSRKGRTKAHLADMRHKVGRILSECGFSKLSDLAATRTPAHELLEEWLSDRIADAKEHMSARTANAYATAAASFGKWLVRRKRLATNPFAGVDRQDEATDRRHVRRAMTADELDRFLEVAETRPVKELLTVRVGPNKGKRKANVRPEVLEQARRLGRQRALLWRVLAYTGLRFNEGVSLLVGDIVLTGPKPCIHLRAENEKARRGATVPLRADLARELAEYLAERLAEHREDSVRLGKPVAARLAADDKLFPLAPASVRVFDRDLAAAEIAKVDAQGRVLDIHSLRGTFATLLTAAGVPLATAQVLMRHTTPTLTAKHYIDRDGLDVRGAIEKLPGVGSGRRERMAAIMGGKVSPKVSRKVSLAGAFSCPSLSSADTLGECATPEAKKGAVSKKPRQHGAERDKGCQAVLKESGTGEGGRTLDLWIHNPAL